MAKLKIIIILIVVFAVCTEVYSGQKYNIRIVSKGDVDNGSVFRVPVVVDSVGRNIDSFSFSIQYDPNVLVLLDVQAGSFIERCDWQYFDYNICYHSNPNLKYVDILGRKTIDLKGPGCDCCHPRKGDTLAMMVFYADNKYYYNLDDTRLMFYWNHCLGNTMTSAGGDEVYMSDRIFDYDGDELTRNSALPTTHGCPAGCLTDLNTEGFPVYMRAIDFIDAHAAIKYDDYVCRTGDINNDALDYNLLDFCAYQRFFKSCGEPIYCSDINGDGIEGTIEDYIYFVRKFQYLHGIYSECLPPEDVRIPRQGHVYIERYNGRDDIFVSSEVSIGAFYFSYLLGDTEPIGVYLPFRDRSIKKVICGDTLKIFEYGDLDSISSPAYMVNLIRLFYSGPPPELLVGSIAGSAGEKVQLEIDYYTDVTDVTVFDTPAEYALRQNYPNPFNPATEIRFDLPGRIEWRLEIFDITGRKVRSFDGVDPAGTVALTWDGTDGRGEALPTGVYLYRLKAGEYTSTKKMLLLK